FRKLVHICYLKKIKVLDLQIPPFANFIANQILVHNSIEQDADIVLLLYREKYYNQALSSLEDVAEIIIAKNRNGKTGTIYLKFQSEIAKFQ
ncbi:MAG: DnaB-like helicase C-terminal domain-containing protein, partial [Cyanobacteria bacterium J06633_23]